MTSSLKLFFNSLLYETNRFQVAMHLFSNRSQRTSKCSKNISDTLGCALCATFWFLPHFNIICDLLLNRRTATWNLSVKLTFFFDIDTVASVSLMISHVSWFMKYTVLSYKLRSYTRISSSDKSRNNTREKIWYFFTCVWYRQSAADTSLAFCTTRSGWWMNGEAFAILNLRSFVGICFGLWLLKH